MLRFADHRLCADAIVAADASECVCWAGAGAGSDWRDRAHYANSFAQVRAAGGGGGEPVWVFAAYSFANYHECGGDCVLWRAAGGADAVAGSVRETDAADECDLYAAAVVCDAGAVFHEVRVVGHGHGDGVAADTDDAGERW